MINVDGSCPACKKDQPNYQQTDLYLCQNLSWTGLELWYFAAYQFNIFFNIYQEVNTVYPIHPVFYVTNLDVYNGVKVKFWWEYIVNF